MSDTTKPKVRQFGNAYKITHQAVDEMAAYLLRGWPECCGTQSIQSWIISFTEDLKNGDESLPIWKPNPGETPARECARKIASIVNYNLLQNVPPFMVDSFEDEIQKAQALGEEGKT